MIKKIILTVFALCAVGFSSVANATQLPDPVVDFLKSKYPDVAIRFDGLIELPDHTIYLPVTPLAYNKVDNPAAIVQTIPAKTDFSKKPDMILFANNLALLKIVKAGNELTVNYSPEIPLAVKLGLLPQDLIVPRGLVLPTELKVILGNLKIAVKEKKDTDDFVFYGDNSKKSEVQVNFNTRIAKTEPKGIKELEFIKGKVLYAANFKENKLNIVDSASGRIYKSMNLPTIPSNIQLTPDERYLFITSMSAQKVFVIDTFNNIFLKDFEVGKYPSSMLMTSDSKKVYVANKFSSSITEINLEEMLVKKTYNTFGVPENLTLQENSKNILYSDADSGNIYELNIASGNSTKVLQVKNISKMTQKGENLYVLSRLSGDLIVFNLRTRTQTAKVQVGEKPVDIKFFDKNNEIYILAAGADTLTILNSKDFTVKSSTKLNSGGYPSQITLFEKDNKAFITNQESFQIVIFDTKKGVVAGSIPVSKNISFLQVLN
jgi:YVTN family beta-propeller protein